MFAQWSICSMIHRPHTKKRRISRIPGKGNCLLTDIKDIIGDGDPNPSLSQTENKKRIHPKIEPSYPSNTLAWFPRLKVLIGRHFGRRSRLNKCRRNAIAVRGKQKWRLRSESWIKHSGLKNTPSIYPRDNGTQAAGGPGSFTLTRAHRPEAMRRGRIPLTAPRTRWLVDICGGGGRVGGLLLCALPT